MKPTERAEGLTDGGSIESRGDIASTFQRFNVSTPVWCLRQRASGRRRGDVHLFPVLRDGAARDLRPFGRQQVRNLLIAQRICLRGKGRSHTPLHGQRLTE